MTRLLISATQKMRRLPIEVTKQKMRALTAAKQTSILRPAQRTKMTSASSRAEYGYARGAWCCYRIYSCNACTYIPLLASLLFGPRPVVSTTPSLPVLSCFSSPARAFANDNSLVPSLLVDINCILKHDLGWSSYARDTTIEDLEFSNHSRIDRCIEEMIKKE